MFINADRDYREGKAQNFLRAEDISRIVHAYRTLTEDFHNDAEEAARAGSLVPVTLDRSRSDELPGYARRVPVSEIEAEDFNCNIRRYVDNAPPPEPHDVRAHLHGGVPVSEVDALQHYWTNYPGLRDRCLVARASPSPNPLPQGEGSILPAGEGPGVRVVGANKSYLPSCAILLEPSGTTAPMPSR